MRRPGTTCVPQAARQAPARTMAKYRSFPRAPTSCGTPPLLQDRHDRLRFQDCRHARSRRRHRPRDHRRGGAHLRRGRRAVRMGRAGRRHGGHRQGGRSAAAAAARQHPAHASRAQGPADHAGGRRLPLGQRAPARRIQALRERAPGAHADPRRPLRRHRPRADPREPRGPLRRLRALHPDRRRSAGRGDLVRRQHARGLAPHRGIRVRLRGQERAQEGHDRAQGERAEGAHRHLPRSGEGQSRSATKARSPPTSASSMRARCSSCSTRGSST